jgi:hypothetical protein
MNKFNGGGQRKQKNTIIPMNKPCAEFRGKPQKMTTATGEAKGLKQMLEEQGFDTQGMRAKCSLVCPIENISCCMACLLSKQDDFNLQESSLNRRLRLRAICVFSFLSSTVSSIQSRWYVFFYITFIAMLIMYSTGGGVNTGTEKFTRKDFRKRRGSHVSALTHALWM